MVAKLASLTNVYNFTLQKPKILNINLTLPARTVTAYPMPNIFLELA